MRHFRRHVRHFPGARVGGTCPSGQISGEASGGSSCACVGSDQTCLISQAPACGGTCPSGQCQEQSGGNACECVTPADTCATSQAPTCGGTCPRAGCCPSGRVCQTSGGLLRVRVQHACMPVRHQVGQLGQWGRAVQRPLGVAVDGSGNVFVADTDNNRIQKFDNNGTFLTEVGQRGQRGRAVQRPDWRRRGRERERLRRRLRQQPHPEVHEHRDLPHQVGQLGSGDGQFNGPVGVAVDVERERLRRRLAATTASRSSRTPGPSSTKWGSFGQRGRAVRRAPPASPWTGAGTSSSPTLQQPHPEVHEQRHLPHQVGQHGQRGRAVQSPQWHRRGWERERLRRRLRQQPRPEVRQHGDLPHRSGAAQAAGAGSSISRRGSPWMGTRTSSSPITASRSSRAHSDKHRLSARDSPTRVLPARSDICRPRSRRVRRSPTSVTPIRLF